MTGRRAVRVVIAEPPTMPIVWNDTSTHPRRRWWIIVLRSVPTILSQPAAPGHGGRAARVVECLKFVGRSGRGGRNLPWSMCCDGRL